MTPFLLDIAAAFDTSAGVAYGPWEFDPAEALLWLHGQPIEACGWRDMARLAIGDATASRWLVALREDVERRLRTRVEHGSVWGP